MPNQIFKRPNSDLKSKFIKGHMPDISLKNFDRSRLQSLARPNIFPP